MKDVYRTKTGVEIGCMYQKPLPLPTREEEIIQRVLLHAQGPDYVSIVTYAVFLCVVFGLAFLLVGSGS